MQADKADKSRADVVRADQPRADMPREYGPRADKSNASQLVINQPSTDTRRTEADLTGAFPPFFSRGHATLHLAVSVGR